MRRPCVVLVLLALVSCGAPHPSRPNVLLISIDSLRADHVGADGYQRHTTPHLDALGTAGVVFHTAISSSSWTLPTHVTLLTALPPSLHGVNGIRRRLAESAVTLAEVLHAAGYETAGFVGGPLLRRIYGHDQGFDSYDDSTVVRPLGQANHGITSPTLVGLVDDWLAAWRRRGTGRPFFVFLHLWDVHYDYAPPPPYDRLFDPDYDGTLDASNFETNPALRPDMPARDLQHLVALYDGEIRFTDEWIGRLLDTLDRMGLTDDTIVVVTADHGDEFFEHGGKGHATTLFDEVLRIPLLMRYPRRIRPGQVVDEQVRLEDVAPTILGLARVDPPADFGVHGGPEDAAGADLTPWLVGHPKEPFPSLTAYALLVPFGRTTAVRTPTHKLIERTQGKRRHTFFYDLRSDPGEHALRPPGKGTGRRLDGMLTRWSDYWKAHGRGLSRPITIDAAHEQQLRALGYVR
jgi:arylsulfatase A-like enzyme